MNIFTRIKEWLLPEDKDTDAHEETERIYDPQLLDDVWIKWKDVTFKGWICDVQRNYVVATSKIGSIYRNFRFNLSRPYTKSIIEQGNTTLYFEDPNLIKHES